MDPSPPFESDLRITDGYAQNVGVYKLSKKRLYVSLVAAWRPGVEIRKAGEYRDSVSCCVAGEKGARNSSRTDQAYRQCVLCTATHTVCSV